MHVRFRCQCTEAVPPVEGWEPCTLDVTSVSDLRAVNFDEYGNSKWRTVHVHRDHAFMFEAMSLSHHVYEVLVSE